MSTMLFYGVPAASCSRRVELAKTTVHTRGHGQSRGGNGRSIGQRVVAHMIATPTESGGPTQVYAIREQRDRESTDVIACTFTLQSISLFSLVDLGSTH